MMDKYNYRSLHNPFKDIRVVHILPGSFEDEIKLSISHKSLADAQPSTPRPPIDIHGLQTSLPPGWGADAVTEEWDYRVLFKDERLITADDPLTHRKTFWDHPDPCFNKETYRPLKMEPPNVGFEALSYVWGSPEGPITATIIEGPSSFTLPITRNLACAIRYLRLANAPRTMWIDAVCINQADLEERVVQVRRMVDIYALADRVVVWLGEHDGDSHKAISLMQRLGEGVVFLEDGSWDIAPSYTGYQPDAEALRSAYHLFQRPWFSRLWVVQEMDLGNRWTVLQCGNTTISRRLFGSAMCYLGYLVDDFPEPSMRLFLVGLMMQMFGTSTRHGTFEDLIRRHRNRGCADPRDKIYGLLGIAREEFRSRIQPDYTADVAKVYHDAVVTEIQASRHLNILNECFLQDRTLEGPSWVPDWSTKLQSVSYRPVPASFTSGTTLAWTEIHDRDILECQGLVYDVISYVGERMPLTEAGAEMHKVIPMLADLVTRRLEHPSSSCKPAILRALSQALCFGDVRERCPMDLGTPKLNEITDWLSGLLKNSSHMQPEQAAHVAGHISRFLGGRSLFITAKGDIGIGPPGMQPGDQVCILLGCDFPMILQIHNGDKYRVVGGSYVAGLGDAMHLLGPLPDGFTAVVDMSGRRINLFFLDMNTGEKTEHDPRLPALDGWESLNQDVVDTSPYATQRYKNNATQEIFTGDPRLSPEALRARGCSIRSFLLV